MMAGRPPKAVDPDASAAAKLGADLRALRVERELTLNELGEKIGFSAQYISGAELARATVSARFVAACDRVLGADGALVALLPDVVWERNCADSSAAARATGLHHSCVLRVGTAKEATTWPQPAATGWWTPVSPLHWDPAQPSHPPRAAPSIPRCPGT
jgi:transcriptional regulator with XRE-family HTH domain